MRRSVLGCMLLFSLCSCSYLKYASVQAEYARIQKAEPAQVNLKHLLDRETFFVLGCATASNGRFDDTSMAIAAYSSRFKPHERVDTMSFVGTGTHYGLTLPAGDYELLVFADRDENRILDKSEVVGQTTISLDETSSPGKVVDGVDIPLSAPRQVVWVEDIPMPDTGGRIKSLFYPTGAIRSLDDPIFSENMATLGMYDPASFLERAHTMFYALEEDLGYKVPVVFVHGIGGSVLNFAPLIERLDRARYKPWFFYYPSGGDLDRFGEIFYRIFFSGTVVRQGEMPMIIIAHSMGGLIVREALNRYEGAAEENPVHLVVTIATPFGGHPAAAMGEKHGLIVLPSWRDVNPESRFIRELFRKPLPKMVNHQLIYAFHNPDTLKLSNNSDGVVPLSSQLRPEAQKQSRQQFGFNRSHTGILDDEEMIAHVLELMADVKNYLPEDHLEKFWLGGYDQPLSDSYSPLTQYVIRNIGRYFVALTRGEIRPFDEEQEKFLRIVQGRGKPRNEVEEGWLRFVQEYPEVLQENN